ncbi:MAG: cytidine deaminase [Ignavibacteria bacterium]
MKQTSHKHLSKTLQRRLIAAANMAKVKAYAPYSNFRVGAAVLTDHGLVYSGCNVENSSYSLTICAERMAVFKALSYGHARFKAIAITSDWDEFLPPCGACRQVLAEFAPDALVVLSTLSGKTRITSLSKLFPLPADLAHLRKKSKST